MPLMLRTPEPGFPHYRIRTLTLLLGLVTALVGCETEPQTVRIGVIASPNFIDAAVIAIEHELEHGPIAGLDTVLVSEGTNRAEPALRFAEELVARPGMIAVIGHSNSAASIAASQIYNQAEVVQIAPTSTATLYREAGPFSFRMVGSDEAQGRFLAEALAESLPAGSSLAVLYVNDDYGRGLRQSLDDALADHPLSTVLELPHAGDSGDPIDQSHLGSALESANPDAVVWLGRHHTLDHAMSTIRQAVADVPIWGSDGVAAAYRYTRGDLDPGWDGVVMVDFLDGSRSEGMSRFDAEYLTRHGTRITASEALTYDAVRVVLGAIREGIRTGPELRAYLAELGDSRLAPEGITGPIQFDSVGDGPAVYQLRTYPPPSE